MLADPTQMAQLHARCFTQPRPWSAAEFADLLADRNCLTVVEPHGFAIARIVLDEAEILTICIVPESQNQGHGSRLLAALHGAAIQRQVKTIFLEVAETNMPARRLYATSGYSEAGIRRNYYESSGKAAVHALVLRCALK